MAERSLLNEPGVAPRYEFLSTIFDNALSAIVTADDTGTITGWNPQAEAVFGWTRAEAIGRLLQDTVMPERYRERHVRGFEHWLKTGVGPVIGTVIELEGLRKDGSEFPIELAISPVVRTPESATIIAFCRDITDRRTAEAGMREAGERLHELTLMQDVAERLSFTVDVEAVCAEAVRAAAEMASSPEGPLRRSSLLRLAGDHTESMAEYDVSGFSFGKHRYKLSDHPILQQVVDTGEPFAGPLNEMPVPASTREIVETSDLVTAAIVPVPLGEEIFGLLTVSARDQHGFTGVQLDRLSAIAHIAGLAIGNAQHFQLMRQHADRAAELEQAKSEFLKLASHELRGPLGVLRGYLSMITDGTLDVGEIRTIAPLLSAKLAQMNDLVNQMLESARLDDSRLELHLEPLDLTAVVQAAVEQHRPLVTEIHQLTADLPDARVLVDGDRERLRTVVSNLVDNAIKYSPSGGAISCTLTTEKSLARVRVSDQGLGIDEAAIDRLFQRFGRLVTSENSHISGTGLGLYLSRRLAQMHGGDITVESKVGKGSTFTLTLPLLKVSSPG